MEEPHARLERFDKDQCLDLDDPNFKLDFIYVLKGGLEIELELDQVQKVLKEKNDSEFESEIESACDDSDLHKGAPSPRMLMTLNKNLNIMKIDENEDEDPLAMTQNARSPIKLRHFSDNSEGSRKLLKSRRDSSLHSITMGKKPSKINVDQKELEDEIRKARLMKVNKKVPTIEIDMYTANASNSKNESQFKQIEPLLDQNSNDQIKEVVARQSLKVNDF